MKVEGGSEVTTGPLLRTLVSSSRQTFRMCPTLSGALWDPGCTYVHMHTQITASSTYSVRVR